MRQREYDQWVCTTNVTQQEQLCGGSKISNNERYFIDRYAKKNILDIGCGTGRRTFPEWIKRNLNFYGIEKFENLINESKCKEKILQADISSNEFIERVEELLAEKFDIAFLFGGVINGIIDRNLQENTWKNFKFLLNKCDYILIDTLSHFDWFETAETGKEIQLFDLFPTQYFYSRIEIEKLNNEFEIEICEERTENIKDLERTHFLLRKK